MELPRTVQEIADVIGRERALFLISQLPRIRVQSKNWNAVFLYAGKTIKPDDNLVKILGWNDASKLVRYFGGELLQLSSCDYIYRRFLHSSMARMHAEGMATKDIAELFGVSERTVSRHCNDKPQKDTTPANDNNSRTTSRRATL